MELREFVKSTIVEIVEGVSDAMKLVEQKDTNAVVNPAASHSYYAPAQKISFDVAVTVQDENSLAGKASGGIAI